MIHIHPFVLRISKWPVWLFFFVGYLVFAVYIMNRAAADMKAACGEDVKIPDIEIGYTSHNLPEMIAAMNVPCRETYHHIATVTDSFYPIFYGFFFFFSIVFLYYKGPSPLRFRGLYFVPLLCIFFDFLENSTLAFLVRNPVNYPTWVLHAAPLCSGLKWLFAFASMLLILLGIVRWVLMRVRKK